MLTQVSDPGILQYSTPLESLSVLVPWNVGSPTDEKNLLVNCASVTMAELFLIVDVLRIYLQSHKHTEVQGVTAWEHMQWVHNRCKYTGERERERWRCNWKQWTRTFRSLQVQQERKNNKRDIRRRREINITFAVQFIKGCSSWVCVGVTDRESNVHLFAAFVPIYSDKKVSEAGDIIHPERHGQSEPMSHPLKWPISNSSSRSTKFFTQSIPPPQPLSSKLKQSANRLDQEKAE